MNWRVGNRTKVIKRRNMSEQSMDQFTIAKNAVDALGLSLNNFNSDPSVANCLALLQSIAPVQSEINAVDITALTPTQRESLTSLQRTLDALNKRITDLEL